MSRRALGVVAALSAAFGLASVVAYAVAGIRSPGVVAVDAARPDARRAVRLEGGAWMCDAVVPASERLTADESGWIPRAGGDRVILVATKEPGRCPPPDEPGVVAPVLEGTYEQLRDRDPARFGALAQRDVLLFFPGKRPRRDRGMLYAGASLLLVSFAMLSRAGRK